jgi:hypothetical protein
VTPKSALGFALSGAIGPVRSGVAFDEVIALWGQPTALRLTRPPSRMYGPVMVLLAEDGTVGGLTLVVGDQGSPAPFELALDLNAETTLEEFRGAVKQAGRHCDLATEEMYDGESEVVVRVRESGVLAVFDENGHLSCLSS